MTRSKEAHKAHTHHKAKKAQEEGGFFSHLFGGDSKMSKSEAGKKGGEAHHTCRGRECTAKKHGHKTH